MNNKKSDFVHVAYLVPFVHSVLHLIHKTSGASMSDTAQLVADRLEKSGILENSSFMEYCDLLLFEEDGPHQIH